MAPMRPERRPSPRSLLSGCGAAGGWWFERRLMASTVHEQRAIDEVKTLQRATTRTRLTTRRCEGFFSIRLGREGTASTAWRSSTSVSTLPGRNRMRWHRTTMSSSSTASSSFAPSCLTVGICACSCQPASTKSSGGQWSETLPCWGRPLRSSDGTARVTSPARSSTSRRFVQWRGPTSSSTTTIPLGLFYILASRRP